MPLEKFHLPKKDTRLIKYKDRVYKVKLQYRNENSDANAILPCGQEQVQSEIEAAIRTVLAMQGELQPFRTDHFVIYPEKKYWNTASLLKFFEHGQQLTGDPNMLNLVVENITDQSEQNQQIGRGQTKEKHTGDKAGRAGPSKSGAEGDGHESTSRGAIQRSRTRQRMPQSSTEDDQESASDVNIQSEPDRPRFHSPPRKLRKYGLRKRSASQSPAPSRRQPRRAAKRPLKGGEAFSGRKMFVLSKENRYLIDRKSEDRVQEGASPGRHQSTPINIHLEVAATASEALQPAHPRGGVLLREMLRPSPGQIEQHQLEEQMRLQRLAGPASVNRGHPAFASPAQKVEEPKSTIKKLIDVVLTPAKRLFSQ